MKRFFLLAAIGAAASVFAHQASARTIDGWLAQCTAVAAGSCTEQTATGYARQPISFSSPVNGVTNSAIPYYFNQGVTGTIAGRAVYDAPTAGRLLVVLPVAGGYVIPSIGDRGDVGSLKFTFTALTAVPNGDAYSGSFLAGATIGAEPDGSTVTAGTNETITRGVLAANAGSADPLPVQVTETTGFSYQIPPSTSTVQIGGAGTLATGTVILPQSPAPGQVLRLMCAVTVTALTLTPGTATTFTGTAPTSCGANASHEFFYFAATSTWGMLF